MSRIVLSSAKEDGDFDEKNPKRRKTEEATKNSYPALGGSDGNGYHPSCSKALHDGISVGTSSISGSLPVHTVEPQVITRTLTITVTTTATINQDGAVSSTTSSAVRAEHPENAEFFRNPAKNLPSSIVHAEEKAVCLALRRYSDAVYSINDLHDAISSSAENWTASLSTKRNINVKPIPHACYHNSTKFAATDDSVVPVPAGNRAHGYSSISGTAMSLPQDINAASGIQEPGLPQKSQLQYKDMSNHCCHVDQHRRVESLPTAVADMVHMNSAPNNKLYSAVQAPQDPTQTQTAVSLLLDAKNPAKVSARAHVSNRPSEEPPESLNQIKQARSQVSKFSTEFSGPQEIKRLEAADSLINFAKEQKGAPTPSPANYSGHHATMKVTESLANNESDRKTSLNHSVHVKEPNAFDILCGRNKAYGKHPGNQEYLKCIEKWVDRYNWSSNKNDKMQCTREIVSYMKSEFKSRFIKQVTKIKDDGSEKTIWQEISDQLARDKVSHALRFAAKNKKLTAAVSQDVG